MSGLLCCFGVRAGFVSFMSLCRWDARRRSPRHIGRAAPCRSARDSLDQQARRGMFGLRRRSGGESLRHASVAPPSRTGGKLVPKTCKIRLSEAGVHLFDRVSGLNVLLDEVDVPQEQVSPAPRYLSVALTNACELRCGTATRPSMRPRSTRTPWSPGRSSSTAPGAWGLASEAESRPLILGPPSSALRLRSRRRWR